MTATLAGILYDEPVETAQPAKQSKPGGNRRNARFAGGPTTDIKEWLAENGPRDYAELTDLRKALYSRRTNGQFVVKHHGETLAGEERFTVTGRESPLLIVSNKSRHYLLRTLCRMVKGR
jgi:hypothetical protein